MNVLQANVNTGGSAELALLAVTLIAAGLALFIVFHAFRGYRRHKSRRMLFLAGGLALITVVPFLLSMLVTVVGYGTAFDASVYTFVLPMLQRVSQIAGLCSILYSLLISPHSSS
jgi:hypothetical protein